MKPWAQALQITETNYEAWLREAPKNESFTFWCLEKGKISPDSYLSWAQEHFELAKIKSDFFKGKPNPELWLKIKSVANWSEHMIPIANWDGTIFIACIEPDFDIRWSFPVRYLLAHPRDLKAYWTALQLEVTATRNVPEAVHSDSEGPLAITAVRHIPDLPEADIVTKEIALAPPIQQVEMPPTQKAPVMKPPPPIRVVPAAQQAPPAPVNAPPPPPKISDVDAPQGLSFTFEDSNKKIDLMAPENLSWRPKQLPLDNDLAPAGFIKVKTPAEISEVPDGMILKLPVKDDAADAQDIPNLTVAVDMATMGEIVPAVEEVHFLSEEVSQAPTMTEPEPEQMTEPAPPTPHVQAASPPASSQPFQSAVFDTPGLPTATVKIEELPTTLNDFVTFIKSEFRGGMLLEIKNEQFVPLIWDENFKPLNPKALARWTLSSASAFRVAFRTKMPYLGHLVDTPINSEFFNVWGFEAKPNLIFIQPIKVHNKVQYLVLALVDQGKKNHHILASGEKIVKEIIARLKAHSEAA